MRFVLDLQQGICFEEMQPAARIAHTEHVGPEGGNEWPVLVSIGALHFGDDVHAGVEAGNLVLPRHRLPYRAPKDVQGRDLRQRLPFEVAGPAAPVPAGIQWWAD